MKTVKLFLLCFFLSLTALAQEFHGTVSLPTYNGGLKALREFIKQNTRQSEEPNLNANPGIVTVSYSVNGKGNVENIKILRGINAECDSEAVRVTKLINGWQAASQWGKPVSVRLIMPVEFFIKNDDTKKGKFTVIGNVTDKGTGNPIEGSLILVKGTNAGATTDKNGNYALEVPGEEYELEFSSLGYGIKTEKVGKNRTINAELLPEDIVVDLSSK